MAYPSVYPTSTTIYDPDKCFNGYTIFPISNPASPQGIVLIDMNGNVINLWEGLAGFPAKVLPGGFVMGSSGSRDAKYGYQDNLDLVQVDWNGQIVWEFAHYERIEDPGSEARWMARQHHDYQREGNPVGYYVPGMDPLTAGGSTLILCHKSLRNTQISDKLLLDDAMIEVTWDGEIVWEWTCSEHFEEMGFGEQAKNTMYRNPGMRKIGEGMGDWMHTNSMSLLGPNKWYDAGDQRFHPDNVIWDGRQTNIIAIIDKRTGKLVWQIGPEYDGTPELRKLGWIIGQHHAHLIPRGLPGEGNILVFDNGGWAGYGAPNPASPTGFQNARRDYSRVLEINPPHSGGRLAVLGSRGWLSACRGGLQVLQRFRQLGAAPPKREHADHRRDGWPPDRSHARTRDRLGVYQPVLWQEKSQYGLSRLSRAL